MESLSIGEVARLAEVGVETVRFYERQGLIAEPPRKESGYRQYPRAAVSRIHFIKRARALGFSLDEIGELLSLRVDPNTTCKDVRVRAEAKIADIEEKITTLQNMRKALVELTAACDGRGPASECPVLQALDMEARG